MGLFKFMKNAGQKYVDMQKKSYGKILDAIDGDDDAAEEKRREVAAETIMKEAETHGLEGDYKVKVEGETVKIEGKVPNQETLEKVVLTAGNVEGIAQVDTDGVEVEEAGDEAVFHTVVSGDSLSKIAKAYLGDAMKYPAIFEANKPMLSDPDKIYPGQVLRIPGGTAPGA